ncbi:MAG: transposase [Patescibacteria group bacterium]
MSKKPKKDDGWLRKALPNIKLDRSNPGKTNELDLLAEEYYILINQYIDVLVKVGKSPDKDQKELPLIKSVLSARWKRDCWRHACGVVSGWMEREGKTPPSVKKGCIKASVNVLRYEPSKTSEFDAWLVVSTLKKGHPVALPIKLHPYVVKNIKYWGLLCTGVELNKRHGRWELTLVVKKEKQKKDFKEVVGIDIGMVSMVSTSEGKQYGQVKEKVAQKVAQQAERTKNKQKLNSCLKKKNKETIPLTDGKAERYVRNEIGKALNTAVKELPRDTAVAFEDLSVATMRMKSREMNRRLRASQLGYIRDKLEYKLLEHGIQHKKVNPAYSSQICPKCGFVHRGNRPTQDKFKCLHCGFEGKADIVASGNLGERFHDDCLNGLDVGKVKSILLSRFKTRFPDVDLDAIVVTKGSASVRLDQGHGDLDSRIKPKRRICNKTQNF